VAYCTNCGQKTGEGAKFCTNCGQPVKAAYSQNTGNTGENIKAQPVRPKRRSYKVGNTDFRKLNNVSLVTKPEHHRTIHIVMQLASIIALIYLLIVVFPVFLPLLIMPGGSDEITYTPGMFPGLIPVFIITIVCGLIYKKTRSDIIRSLPRGFDHWEIRRMLQWHIFGFESLKTAVLRLLGNKDLNYPELGIGTDDEGNYYAFKVPGDETGRYPAYNPSDY